MFEIKVKSVFLHILFYYCIGTISGNNLLPDTKICGTGTEPKIFGGTVTTLDEFPWTALLQSEYSSVPVHCGGSLINNRYVLTAAHCFDRVPIVNVRLGEYNLSTPIDCEESYSDSIKPACAPEPLNIAVEKVIKHKDYNRRRRINTHDIALIRLAEDVNFTKYIKPICLPITKLKETDLGDMATVVGWGRTETRTQSSIKLKVEIPIKSNDKCSLPSDAGQLCAGGDEGKDSCAGDSGGPLMIHKNDEIQSNWYIIGIVSSGTHECASKGIPAVYTKIINYIDWIRNNLEP